MSGYQKQQDLDDIYSDLSDKEQDIQPPKITNPKVPNEIVPKGTTIRMPAFFGGKAFIPPPPPPSSRPPIKIQGADEGVGVKNQTNNFYQGNQIQRERKNIIYLKNLPKSYNRQQTLTTYFRTYGNIKSIKTNEQNNSAFVRFQKQQDVYKFMNSKPMILNRSYIMYQTHEDFVVTGQKIAERQREQNAAQMISSQKQLMVLKENTESLLADKYRALMYLNKNKNKLSDEQIEQVNREIHKCHRIKQSQGDSKALSEMLLNFQNVYDWTLTYKIKTKESFQKKKIINQMQKYGPISTVTIKITSLTGEEILQQHVHQHGEQQAQSLQEKLGVIKIKFLGVRNSWEMFLQNYEKLGIQVDGKRLEDIYKIWLEDAIKQKQKDVEELAKKENAKNQQLEQDKQLPKEQVNCQKPENSEQIPNQTVIKE